MKARLLNLFFGVMGAVTLLACGGGSEAGSTPAQVNTNGMSSSSQVTSSASSSSSSASMSSSSSSSSAASSASTSSSSSASSVAIVGGPAGLFVLDSPLGTNRDGNLRDYDFVAGYAWRYGWYLMEPAQDTYDFSALDYILAKVAAKNKKLSWIVMPTSTGTTVPTYIYSQSTTWVDKTAVTFPVPWDSYVLARYKKFLEALAAHKVADPAQGGAMVSLGDHSAFYAINITFPGVPNLAIRDKRDNIVDVPGYSRIKFQDAIVATLRVVRTSFPKQYIHFGFWTFANDKEGGEAWQALRDRVLSEFGNSVGFFMDNIAATRPCTTCDPYSGTPTIDYAAPLFSSINNTYAAFQALASWTNPNSMQADKVLNGTPMDGIDYGLKTFKSKYVELYVEDVDRADWQAGLKASAALLTQ